MLAKRIIPCLDIKDSRTVKGVNFVDLIDAGDPVELARYYSENGADELVFLDITATKEDRRTFAKLADEISENINIPFTVGGGIKTVEDVDILLKSGADKVSINSYAVKNPDFINELATNFGTQCIVVAIDAKYVDNDWFVYLVGGRVKTDIFNGYQLDRGFQVLLTAYPAVQKYLNLDSLHLQKLLPGAVRESDAEIRGTYGMGGEGV